MKLAIFDTNCLAHKCVRSAHSAGLSEEDERIYYTTVIMWADALGFVPKLRDRDDVTSCWITDSKPYWRTKYKLDYKGNRKKRTDEVKTSLDIFEQCFELADIPLLGIPQYEADDIAGAIVKLWEKSQRNFDELFLVTVDSDWQGLVVDDSVCWLNLLNYAPRARRTPEVYQWLVKDYNKSPKYKKKAWELPSFYDFSSAQIWEWKGVSGDKADNIEAADGHWLTDLFEQPPQWNLANHSQTQIFKFIATNQRRVKTDWFSAEQSILSLGLSLPVEPIVI